MLQKSLPSSSIPNSQKLPSSLPVKLPGQIHQSPALPPSERKSLPQVFVHADTRVTQTHLPFPFHSRRVPLQTPLSTSEHLKSHCVSTGTSLPPKLVPALNHLHHLHLENSSSIKTITLLSMSWRPLREDTLPIRRILDVPCPRLRGVCSADGQLCFSGIVAEGSSGYGTVQR